MPEEAFLQSLARLSQVLDANAERSKAIEQRIAQIREGRAAGRSYADIVSSESRPLIVQLLTDSAEALDSAGVVVRRSEAQALHGEGLTMEEIARLFGVSRQRVSALLRAARDRAGEAG